MKKINSIYTLFLAFLFIGFSSCSEEGEGVKLFKSYNEDQNDFLDDNEFYNALGEMGYFEAWNQDNDQVLSEDEWSAGIRAYLGGYEVATLEKFGEWDLNGDNELSVEEFREGLFEVIDEDDNGQISESEFTRFYKEGDTGTA